MLQDNNASKTVVVLGASPNPERYAYRAMQKLKQHGFNPVPVNPAFKDILGEPRYCSISDIKEPIDTVTLYLGSARSKPLMNEIIAAYPKRIIFNPGAENPVLAEQARSNGIETVEGCTLVMLATGSF